MGEDSPKILLVEDSPGDIRLLQEALDEAGVTVHVTQAHRMAEALRHAGSGMFDVVLLDLTLPDVKGVETVHKMKAALPGTPIVVLTGLDDESTALQAVQAGAQDYLVKGQADGLALLRAIRYAIERQRLGAQRDRELQSLERFAQGGEGISTDVFGSAPLRESLPDVFDELVHRYGELLDQATDQRLRNAEMDFARDLRAMAERMGVLRAGPADVLEIHASALRSRTLGASARKAEAQVEQARLMALVLMGYLAGIYRRYSLTGVEPPAADSAGLSDSAP